MKEIKKSFIHNVYRELNSDLSNFNDIELINHYKLYGKSEGRACSDIRNRVDFFSMIDDDLSILEVGKLCFPIFENSKNIDVFSKEELIENYSNDTNVNVEKMCDVDYLIKDNNWLVDDKFNYIVSSHNIEHSPCLVSFINNIDKCMEDDGFAFLVIPDFRYCFDANKSPSSLVDVLDSYYTKRSVPGLKSVVEHKLLSTHNNHIQHWSGGDKENNSKFEFDIDSLKEIIKNTDFNAYNDVHCWMFTPESFEKLISSLNELCLINLTVREIYPTQKNSNEFFCVLEKI